MSDLFGIGTLISGALGFGASIYNTNKQEEANIRNAKVQKEINDANIAAQKEINQQNIDYVRSMTQAQWERDDNAYQRQVADLEAAGLSPLAATSGGAGNSTPTNSPNLQAAQQYPSHYQAPQFDINSVINSATKFMDLKEKHDENLSKQNYRTSSINQKTIQLQIQQDQLNSLNEYRYSKLSQENEHFIQTFQLQNDIFEHTKSKDLQELDIKSFCAKSQAVFNALNYNLPDKNLPHKIFYIKNQKDLDLYDTHYQLYVDSFTRYLNEVEHTAQYKASANSNYTSRSAKGGLNFNDPSMTSPFGGVDIGASAARGTSSYSAESKDKNQIFDESWAAYCMKNEIYYPVPVDLRLE